MLIHFTEEERFLLEERCPMRISIVTDVVEEKPLIEAALTKKYPQHEIVVILGEDDDVLIQTDESVEEMRKADKMFKPINKIIYGCWRKLVDNHSPITQVKHQEA